MSKKMISIKLDEKTIELLKELSKNQSRSQGGQIEFMIQREAKELNITIDDKAAS